MATCKNYICEYCSCDFVREYKFEKSYRQKLFFCSLLCLRTYQREKTTKAKTLSCSVCDKFFVKDFNQIKKSKSGNHFCSRSCSAISNNKNKTYGTRISKIELFIQDNLKIDYPDLEFVFNTRKIIDYELDIFIPKISIAFEINGIFHYSPIFGQQKFDRVNYVDQQKITQCEKNTIILHTIDISKLKRFTNQNALPYYESIKKIIDQKLVAQVGLEPTL